jgi:hypothetical protein
MTRQHRLGGTPGLEFPRAAKRESQTENRGFYRPPVRLSLCYSPRSADDGSTAAARRAGT